MSQTASGRVVSHKETLTSQKIQQRQAHNRAKQQDCFNHLTQTELDNITAIRNNLTANEEMEDTGDADNDWEMNAEDVLEGAAAIDLSHAGGKFAAIVNLADNMLNDPVRNTQYVALDFYPVFTHPAQIPPRERLSHKARSNRASHDGICATIGCIQGCLHGVELGAGRAGPCRGLQTSSNGCGSGNAKYYSGRCIS